MLIEKKHSIDQILWEWVSATAEDGKTLLFDYLRGIDNSCNLTPVSDTIVKQYVTGVRVREYTFAIQVVYSISSVQGDSQNLDNMDAMRGWQTWLETQSAEGNLPDFGENRKIHKITIGDAPTLDQMYDNGLAKYSFYTTITYEEHPPNHLGTNS